MLPNATNDEIDMSQRNLEAEPLTMLIAPQAGPRKFVILWKIVSLFIYMHIAAAYGLYLLTSALWRTIAFNCVLHYLCLLAITAGAHRLWSHRTYKATMPLQIFLMLCFCLSGMWTIFTWVRDHRLHHKYSDTDADPHNATRGFFFSHIGWLAVDRHPEIYKRGKLVDMSDILNNPVIQFQKRYKGLLLSIFTLIIPVVIPMYFWDETLSNAHHINVLRVALVLHAVSLVNSLAHMYGNQPYDKGIKPTQNIIATVMSLGEGYHNYHHTFPQDYKTGELGSFLNCTKSFIDLCARLGLAYDLKSVTEDVVRTRMQRTGDGATKDDF